MGVFLEPILFLAVPHEQHKWGAGTLGCKAETPKLMAIGSEYDCCPGFNACRRERERET